MPTVQTSNMMSFYEPPATASNIMAQAAPFATSTISDVSRVINRMALQGTASLSTVDSALSALTSLTFTAPNITFTPPPVQPSSLVQATAYTPGAQPSVPAAAPTLSFNMGANPAIPPAISAPSVPAPHGIRTTTGSAPVVGAKPAAPTVIMPTPDAPPSITVGDFTSSINPTLPSLLNITMPVITLPTLPEFAPLDGGTLPDAPVFNPAINVPSPEFLSRDAYSKMESLLSSNGMVALDDIAARHAQRSADRILVEIVALDNYVTSRGMGIEATVLDAVRDHLQALSDLQHSDTLRGNVITKAIWLNQALQLAVQMGAEAQAFFMSLHLAVAKIVWEAQAVRVDAMAESANALVALYNAKITGFNAEVDAYRAEIEVELLPLRQYEAEVTVAKASGQLNKQLARQYAITAEASTVAVDGYAAKVLAVKAKVDAYNASMQAAGMYADVAKAEISAYAAEVDAYRAELTGYKAVFDQYQGESKRISAINAARASAVRTQNATAEVVAATANSEAAGVEVAASALRVTALQATAANEAVSINNSIGAITAAVQEAIYSGQAKGWGASLRGQAANADAQASLAKTLAVYYNRASDGAYKAAETAQRATTTAATAIAGAAEQAGRAAASTVQGALSAVRVGASITGAGSVSGSQEGSIQTSADYTFQHSNTNRTIIKG